MEGSRAGREKGRGRGRRMKRAKIHVVVNKNR